MFTDLDSEHWEVNFLAELGQDNTGGNDRIDELDGETPGEELYSSYSEADDSTEMYNISWNSKSYSGIFVIWFLD